MPEFDGSCRPDHLEQWAAAGSWTPSRLWRDGLARRCGMRARENWRFCRRCVRALTDEGLACYSTWAGVELDGAPKPGSLEDWSPPPPPEMPAKAPPKEAPATAKARIEDHDGGGELRVHKLPTRRHHVAERGLSRAAPMLRIFGISV